MDNNVSRAAPTLPPGFVNQVAPLYLSEMAPYNYRGGMNVCFQLCITIVS